MKKNVVPMLIIAAIAVSIYLASGWNIFSTVSSPEKDYTLNSQCQTYDSCLSLLKQQYTAEQSAKMFGCDSAGCYMIVTKEVVSK